MKLGARERVLAAVGALAGLVLSIGWSELGRSEGNWGALLAFGLLLAAPVLLLIVAVRRRSLIDVGLAVVLGAGCFMVFIVYLTIKVVPDW